MKVDDQNYKDVTLFTRSLSYYRTSLSNNLNVESYRDIKWLMIKIISSHDFQIFVKGDIHPYIGTTLNYLNQRVKYSDLGVDGMYHVSFIISYCADFINNKTNIIFNADFV